VKEILTIDVKILEPFTVQGSQSRITMLPFTGTASGEYFTGHTIGPGVDTQTFVPGPDGKETACLSARYMLEGKDFTGALCRIFIDNSKQDQDGWHPVLVTDSKALAGWEAADLVASVDPTDGGVRVRVYQRDTQTD